MAERRTKGGGRELPKLPSGIPGLDEITGGGLPRARATLVCGGAGCGKTLLGVEFVALGAQLYGEPGAFFAFEESTRELAENVRSLGLDLRSLMRTGLLHLEQVRIEPGEIVVAGEFTLDALFVRLERAITTIGAKRMVLDSLEGLFGGIDNPGRLRAELGRLIRWLKDRGVTAVITAERGEGTLTRHGVEEYVSDCVILLDNRISDQVATRRVRIVKYRGSPHGSNEYPFFIDRSGLSVLPIFIDRGDYSIQSIPFDDRRPASAERISSGVEGLDEMFGGGGVYRGSSILISGTTGSGKTSLAAHFVRASCAQGEPVLYLSFEEAESQIVRDLASIGVDLEGPIRRGLLRIESVRPTMWGLERHLVRMQRAVAEVKPRLVVVDPISNIDTVGARHHARAMLVLLIDGLKARQITAVFTSLSHSDSLLEQGSAGISSLMDTWIDLREVELNGERNRIVCIRKARGIAHSNQIREFRMTDTGIQLADLTVSAKGMLTGSSRLADEAGTRASARAEAREAGRWQRAIERKRAALAAQITAPHAELKSQDEELSEPAEAAAHRKVAGRIGRAATSPRGKSGIEPTAGKRKRSASGSGR